MEQMIIINVVFSIANIIWRVAYNATNEQNNKVVIAFFLWVTMIAQTLAAIAVLGCYYAYVYGRGR